MLTVLDLFSGIGGFSLGLERTGGFRTVAFCEIDKHARKVLARHWPEIPCFKDVRKLTAARLARKGISAADVVCGGFPCQDISLAGKGGGLEGKRSGLWWEFHRLIGEIKPRYAIIENVSALRSRGLGEVLRSLAEIGYDAEWHCIPASAVGAPHQRDRVWIVAYAQSIAERRCGMEQNKRPKENWNESENGAVQGAAADSSCLLRPSFFRAQQDRALQSYWPETWPRHLENICGMDDGIPNEVGELARYGNAVVPQIPEIVGRAILEKANETRP